MTFRVGQKVVCVLGGKLCGGYGDEILPVKGEIYTIRSVESRLTDIGFETCLRLVEISNKTRMYIGWSGEKDLWEPDFTAKRFRPLVERKTSIEVFKRLLVPNKRAKEDA